ncbi:MAG: non-canonical purine NTP pyrophosphatase [Bacteroidetes bacterium]|nr:non-canonical purine NTP pyrophosphatase [Bacteroidota bacterium]
MAKELVFATNNEHKLKEIQQILGEAYQLKCLKDIGCNEDIPETGETLEENASLKSIYVLNKFKMDCFADDTGLEIEALDGRPGVYSARYGGESHNAEKNIERVLTELKGIQNRKARFRTVISLRWKSVEYLFEGIVEGKVIDDRRGDEGFGYDPIFVPDAYSETFAEMDAEEKNKISHRGRATQKLIAFLKDIK